MLDQPHLPGMPRPQCDAQPPDRARIIEHDYVSERRCSLPAGHTGPHHYAWHEPRYLDVITDLV